MARPFALIDFETASACDLKKCGAWVYAADLSTEILCLGFTTGNEAMVLTPDDLARRSGPLWDMAHDSGVMFVAHNAAFEKAIWREIMVKVYGWPDIPNDRWHDIMAVCAMKGLPLKLERAAMALRLHHQKDTEGTRVTLSLGKPNRRGYYDRPAEKLARVYDYNRRDCVAELELHRRVGGLGPDERRVWLLDQRINERGVGIDLNFVRAAQAICDAAAVPLATEFSVITNGLRPTQRDQFLGWLTANGADVPNLQKATLAKLLGEDDEEDDSLAGEIPDIQNEVRLPDNCRRALQIRQVLGSASIKKLAAMRSCVGTDGRARGLLQYHGAGPGRWAGRLLQPQNFPRGSMGADPEQVVKAILTEDAEWVRSLYGEPISVVASSLRHAIIAPGGHSLVVGDFATIEARIVLAIAGQHDKTALMAAGHDIYIDMAEKIFKCPVDKKRDPEKRQTGKNSVLGCGFQMGWRKFKARYAEKESDEFAQRCIEAYRKEFAPKVPKLWYALEEAAVKAVHDKRPYEAYGILYRLEDGWLTARLPSGRCLWYRDPVPTRKAMPWDETDVRLAFEYRAWKMGQWKTVQAYGGLLTENVVQATARDLLVHAMFKAEDEGLPIVLTVHDELVCEVPDSRGATAETLHQIMCDAPQWARELQIPVGAECWQGQRYRK